MDSMIVRGGKKLFGEVKTSGAKNSSLPLLFATLLAEGKHIFHNVPRLKDIESTCQLLTMFGCGVEFQGNTLCIDVKPLKSQEAHYDVVRKMRASILCLGPLVAKYGEAQVSLPGGCAIGTRPINLHLDGLKDLGADIEMKNGYVVAKAKRLKGATVIFETCTVGGTENILMAASLADGRTVIENAAKEPEIVDLAEYLIKMGAKIKGAGTSTIVVDGVDTLSPAEHSVIPDRIEAGTLVIAGAITGGDVTVTHCEPGHLSALVEKLKECGVDLSVGKSHITVKGNGEYQGCDISTSPHPAFPTDLQAQFMAMMINAHGTSVITEGIFENRFMHVQELVRLGADITLKNRIAVVRGTPGKLTGAPVMATDLRASASLVLAGLVASGETKVGRIYHLDRGYERLEEKLSKLGANIERAN
jgi:UDP-N-acetylglucosamine 1-carboxyvinyltransferase